MIPRIKLALPSDHFSEILLLGMLGAGVLWVLWQGITHGMMLDVAAFLLILQRIVEAVQKRWEQRSIDRMGQSLAEAEPPK